MRLKLCKEEKSCYSFLRRTRVEKGQVWRSNSNSILYVGSKGCPECVQTAPPVSGGICEARGHRAVRATVAGILMVILKHGHISDHGENIYRQTEVQDQL